MKVSIIIASISVASFVILALVLVHQSQEAPYNQNELRWCFAFVNSDEYLAWKHAKENSTSTGSDSYEPKFTYNGYRIKQKTMETIESFCSKAIDYGRLIMNASPETETAMVIIPKGSGSPELKLNVIPKTLHVTLGVNSTIFWENKDDVAVSIESDDGIWDTGMIIPGGSASVTFNQTGTYPYHGSPHPWVKGEIIVK